MILDIDRINKMIQSNKQVVDKGVEIQKGIDRAISNIEILRKTNDRLYTSVDKIEQEIEDYDKGSMISKLKGFFSNEQDIVSKKQLEALAIKKDVANNQGMIENYLRESNAYKKQLEDFQDSKEKYEIGINDKLNYLRIKDPIKHNKIMEIKHHINTAQTRLDKLKGAMEICQEAIQSSREAEDYLGSARNWGTYDILGGGMITTAIKRNKMSQSKDCIDQMNLMIDKLNNIVLDKDLINVKTSMDNESSVIAFADYYFDNIFVDVSVQNRIVESLYSIVDMQKKLINMEDQISKNMNVIKDSLPKYLREFQYEVEIA